MDEFDLDIGPLNKLIDCWCLPLGMLCPSCGLEDRFVIEGSVINAALDSS